MDINQTTLEEPISLRDTIENAIESTESAVTENTTSQDAVESDKTSRPRDESGKFAKSSQNASKELTEASDDNVVENDTNVAEITTKPRPSSWKKDYEEHWGKLDPTLQDYIQQREADYAKGVSTYKNQWDMAQPLVHAIEPFMPLLQEHSIEPSTWISNLGKAHATLAMGSPEQKQQMFAQLANDYGINLGSITGQGYDPQFSQLAQELNQIKNQWTSFQSSQERIEQAQLQNEISSFKDDKPYFEEVRETMAGLLQSGMANDLQSAYDKAIRLNDDVFQKVNATQAQKSEAAQREKVAAAKAKVLSPKSTTPTASVSSGGKSASSARDAIMQAFEQHSSGLI
jgi:hypothetical protein